MYKKGDAEIVETHDSATDDYNEGTWIALPHSCDKWVIGTPKEAQDLIDDLQELIKNFPTHQ